MRPSALSTHAMHLQEKTWYHQYLASSPLASSSEWVPRSTMVPFSMTSTSSAFCTVLNLQCTGSAIIKLAATPPVCQHRRWLCSAQPAVQRLCPSNAELSKGGQRAPPHLPFAQLSACSAALTSDQLRHPAMRSWRTCHTAARHQGTERGFWLPFSDSPIAAGQAGMLIGPPLGSASAEAGGLALDSQSKASRGRVLLQGLAEPHLCAIVMTVRPTAMRSRASCTAASLSASRAEVACSRTMWVMQLCAFGRQRPRCVRVAATQCKSQPAEQRTCNLHLRCAVIAAQCHTKP